MCHPVLIHPTSIELAPSGLSGKPASDLYDLRVLYVGSRDWQHMLLVHVPPQVQRLFVSGEVLGFAVAHLVGNSSASLSFDMQPRSVVLGVELSDGTRINCTPRPLTRAFWRQALLGACLVVAGGAIAVVCDSVLAAAVAALSTHFLRTAAAIPRKPSW